MSKAKMYGCFKPVKRNCTPPRWGKVPRGNNSGDNTSPGQPGREGDNNGMQKL